MKIHMPQRALHQLLPPLLLVAGCGSDGPSGLGGLSAGGTATTAGTTRGGGTEGTSAGTSGVSSSGGATGGATADGGDDAPIFDVGTNLDAGGPAKGCQSVDFLFVIDNSASMDVFQQELIDNFPVFIAGVQDTLTNVDSYHVGVVTTDEYVAAVDPCRQLSSLVVRTGGSNSSNAICGPYAEGNNFMTEADDLPASFACAAQVGTLGDGLERPMQAVEEAVTGVDAGPGQCNEGFIRDDALLVIVIITDEADGPGDPEGAIPNGASPGTPASWYQTVVDAKQGLANNVVSVSFLNYDNGPCPPTQDGLDGKNIAEFTAMFGANGFLGGICEPDYGPAFSAAVGVIADACDKFTPPG